MSRPAPIIHRITPCPAQIADRFVGRLRNIDLRQFTSPQQSRQFARIAPVGFDPIPRALRGHRRRHHLAPHSELLQPPRQPKTARPRFIARPQLRFLAMRFTQPCDPIFRRVQIVTDGARVAHFASASFLCRCRQDTVFVDI